MLSSSGVQVGLLLLGLGLGLVVLTLGILRALPRYQAKARGPLESTIPLGITKHTEALLLIKPGGRVGYLNDQARAWFNLGQAEPNLEHLARLARPSRTFLSLCAGEGQARLSVNGRIVDAVSFVTPAEPGPEVLIALRRPQVSFLSSENENGEGQNAGADGAFQIFSELSQAMARSLELEETLRAILEGVERLIPSDLSEITLLEAETQRLTPYRIAGLPGTDRQFEKGMASYSPGEGFSGLLYSQRTPLYVPDVAEFKESHPELQGHRSAFASYVGVPLIASGDFVGTLELAAYARQGFGPNDLEMLRVLAGQAALAIHNALLYEQEQHRALEFSGLASLAQAVRSIHDSKDLFSHLVENLASLLKVEIAGFVMFDEARQVLIGQTPFHGIQDSVVKWLHIQIEPGTPAEKIWSAQETIVTDHAPEELRLMPLGLHHLAQVAGMHSAVFLPLTSGGRRLGYLCTANKCEGTSFDSHDLRLISIIAGQVAPLLENASLVEQSLQRAQRSETLRRITSLTNSNATLDEILKYSLLDLARLMIADVGAVFLIDEARGDLHLHQESAVGINLDPGQPVERISSTPPGLPAGLDAARRSFMTGDITGSGHPLLAAYRPFLEQHTIQSVILAPLVVREHIMGMVVLGSAQLNFFRDGDLISTETIAGQLASAIEKSNLYAQGDQDLHQRIEQLAALTRLNRELNSHPNLPQSLQLIQSELQKALKVDCGRIVLLKPDNLEEPGVLFQTGEGDLEGLLPVEQQAVQAGEPIILADYSDPQVQPLTPPHAGIRSSLVVPIRSAGQVTGLIHQHGRQPHHFGLPQLEIAEVLAGQAAWMIDQYHQQQALQTQIERLQEGLEENQQMAQEADQQLIRLQDKEAEQSLVIFALSQRIRHITTGLQIVSIINNQPNRSGLLQSLGQEFLDHMGFDVVLIADQSESGTPRLAHTLGNIPSQVNPGALFGQRNPLRQGFQSKQAILVNQLEGNEWQSSLLLRALECKGFVCLPIGLDEQTDIVLLALSQAPLAAFTPGDQQLFDLISRQAGIALHNLHLSDETAQRLHEVNLLLQFSHQLGSLDPGKILQALADSASRAVPAAQSVMITLWHGKQNALIPQVWRGYPKPEHLVEMRLHPGEGLAGQAFESMQPLLLDEIHFAQHHNLTPDNLRCFRDATAGQLPVSSLVVPILAVTQAAPLGVLVLENAQNTGAFTQEDLELTVSLAQQTALSLENARLYQASQQRAAQLQALTQVAGDMTSSLQTAELIDSLLDRIRDVLPYDTGILWLRKENQASVHPSLVVRAAHGFEDSDQRLGLEVAVEDSLLMHEMSVTCQPLSVPNVQDDPRFPAMWEYERLSWLGIPLVASGQVVGVIALEKTEPYFYTPEHIQLATTFAGQAAAALENARLFQESIQRTQELDQRSQLLSMLNRLSSELSVSLDASYILNFAIQELLDVLPCSAISAIVFDPAGQAVLQAEVPTPMDELPVILPPAPIFERLRQTLGVFHTADAASEEELIPLRGFLSSRQTRSLLILPVAASGVLHGLLLAHSTQDIPFQMEEIDLARTISNQVAISAQNARLFAETRSLSEDLEQRVQARTVELAREHQRTRTLLQIMTELSASLDLDQVLTRSIEILNKMIDAEQITILIARPGQQKLHRLASMGYAAPVPTGGSPTPFDVDQGLAGWVITNRDSALIPDVNEDPRWLQMPDAPSPEHRSAMAVPLMIGADALGALLLFHSQVDHFSADQLELAQAAANQAAIAVNNAELYRLIRDQAEDLGNMLRNQQVETSRTRSILEAVADGVLVTDANNSITLFNESAERILELTRSQVLGKPLDHFAGLFGSSAQSWRETIQNWSMASGALQPGETYTEQITLENGRVVEVHLAPVGLNRAFLGTVSIFRDITHQVEVDRLKSEFVATVSHELRTPMTSIKGYVEILLMGAGGPLSEQQARFLGIVKTNTERLAVLVNDLLDLSRIESGKATLNLQPVNLDEIAAQAISDLTRRAEEEQKQITIHKQTAPDLPRVVGDPERVRQIINNLLDNAYLYNLPEGQIQIHLQALGQEVQVDVQDTGMGIPKVEQRRIFERFYRGESPLVLGVSGTGLGLSIVQNLVQMHQGRIWFVSNGIPGEGSTFSFTLPAYIPGVPGD